MGIKRYLVERLRQGVARYEEADAEAIMDRAAAEIERLRAALEAIQYGKVQFQADIVAEFARRALAEGTVCAASFPNDCCATAGQCLHNRALAEGTKE